MNKGIGEFKPNTMLLDEPGGLFSDTKVITEVDDEDNLDDTIHEQEKKLAEVERRQKLQLESRRIAEINAKEAALREKESMKDLDHIKKQKEAELEKERREHLEKMRERYKKFQKEHGKTTERPKRNGSTPQRRSQSYNFTALKKKKEALLASNNKAEEQPEKQRNDILKAAVKTVVEAPPVLTTLDDKAYSYQTLLKKLTKVEKMQNDILEESKQQKQYKKLNNKKEDYIKQLEQFPEWHERNKKKEEDEEQEQVVKEPEPQDEPEPEPQDEPVKEEEPVVEPPKSPSQQQNNTNTNDNYSYETLIKKLKKVEKMQNDLLNEKGNDIGKGTKQYKKYESKKQDYIKQLEQYPEWKQKQQQQQQASETEEEPSKKKTNIIIAENEQDYKEKEQQRKQRLQEQQEHIKSLERQARRQIEIQDLTEICNKLKQERLHAEELVQQVTKQYQTLIDSDNDENDDDDEFACDDDIIEEEEEEQPVMEDDSDNNDNDDNDKPTKRQSYKTLKLTINELEDLQKEILIIHDKSYSPYKKAEAKCTEYKSALQSYRRH